MSKKPTIGMPILFFPSGSATPLAGTVAGIEADDRVNITFTDTNGLAQNRQGVPFSAEPVAAGFYVVPNMDGDSTKAAAAHIKAMEKAFIGKPAPSPASTQGNNAKKNGTPAAGDFTSAALAQGNLQPAGSGGPFDPANTSKAHMSNHQTEESNSVGNPTTGGMTPKLSAETMGQLSERDREAATALMKVKDAHLADQADKIANSGTGVATRGTAEMIANSAKDRQKAAEKAAKDGTAKGEPPVRGSGVNVSQKPENEEEARDARMKRLHEEAVKLSAAPNPDRVAELKSKEAKPAAKTAAKKAAPAKKVAAKKAVPAKKVAAKKKR